MADNDVQALLAQINQQQVAAATQLARFSEPEFWFGQSNVAFTAAGGVTQVTPPGPPNLTRSVESMTITARLRVTVTVAPYTAVSPEAPQNFLQLVQLNGNHKDFGGITPVRMSGAMIAALGQVTQQTNGTFEAFISKNGGALTRAGSLGRPLASPFDGTVATHDMILIWTIPFGPSVAPSAVKYKQATNFLLQPLDWGNTLNCSIQMGDASSFGDPTGATVAFAGFGGTGNPAITVALNYALLGDFQNKMQRSGVVMRNEQALNSQTALGTNVLLSQLSHQITSLVLLRTGRVQTAGLTAAVNTLATVSDVQLEATQLVVDNKPIRNNIDNFVLKSYHERMLNCVVAEGYFPLFFCEGGSALLAYRGDKLPGGSQFNLQSNVITANAAQRQFLLQEYILGGPFPA